MTETSGLLNSLSSLDHAVFEWTLFHLNPRWLVDLAFYSGLNSTLATVALIFWFPWFWRQKKKALYFLIMIVLAILLSDAISLFLKNLFGRARPVTAYHIFYNPDAFSFPSAHAMNAMTCAIIAAFHFGKARYLKYILIVPLLIGISRVISHYHFPGDILGGWLFGALLGTLLGFFWRKAALRWNLAPGPDKKGHPVNGT